MDCNCLIHPFQHDPGTSQRERVLEDLLAGAAKIDARTLADLMDYFMQMARHINFYDQALNPGDWQPFFRNSLPFTVAGIINYPEKTNADHFALYRNLFLKRPSVAGLRLVVTGMFYRYIARLNDWSLRLAGSGLPLETALNELIRKKLQAPVKSFVRGVNTAVNQHAMRCVDFQPLAANPIWNLTVADLLARDPAPAGNIGRQQRQIALYQALYDLTGIFYDAVRWLAAAAGPSLSQSFVPLREELRQKNPPHLALLFVFLQLFQQFQDRMNRFTRKHLDFFYQDILGFAGAFAVPDKTFLVFEIQKLLRSYLLRKGIRGKDGKDLNKQDILFALEEDLVINQTQIAEQRTLFLNNGQAHAKTYTEGVYMAPAAAMADGVDQAFSADPKNVPTLGSHDSKFTDPATAQVRPYPDARIGFAFASPVLSLQAGSLRTITLTIPCLLHDSVCAEAGLGLLADAMHCCREQEGKQAADASPYPDFFPARELFDNLQKCIGSPFIYISETRLREATRKGFDKKTTDGLRKQFLSAPNAKKNCYCDADTFLRDAAVDKKAWDSFLLSLTPAHTSDQLKLLGEIFPAEHILQASFSGEKSWIVPAVSVWTLGNLTADKFTLQAVLTLPEEAPAVVPFQPEPLDEVLGTVQPVVRVLLSNRFKLLHQIQPGGDVSVDPCRRTEACCLLRHETDDCQWVSPYHFFRNVTVAPLQIDQLLISVQVCGLKNIIVQNEDSVMDVNGPIYPFGTRPDIVDFDLKTPPSLAGKGPSFFIGSEEIFFKKWDALRVNVQWKDKPLDFKEYYAAYIETGLDETHFRMRMALLHDGTWTDDLCGRRPLFANSKGFPPPSSAPVGLPSCVTLPGQHYVLYQQNVGDPRRFIRNASLGNKLEANTRNGFVRITLEGQDFLHKEYPFVLARQMMALGRLPDVHLTGAVYRDDTTNAVFTWTGGSADLAALKIALDSAQTNVTNAAGHTPIGPSISSQVNPAQSDIVATAVNVAQAETHLNFLAALNSLFGIWMSPAGAKIAALIPNEPWTPIISRISLDYSASAYAEDVELIHLYPFKDTYKSESLSVQPGIFPVLCDEGTLFLGLKDFVPGDQLSILFQLAEATSNSESEKEPVYWSYLEQNNWRSLRPGFEIVSDGTEHLTASGIVRLALPGDMTSDNTVMPAGLHWIRAAIRKNSGSVSETTAIYTQAVRAVFDPATTSDTLRLAQALPGRRVSKLEVEDSAVKSVSQPFASFGGAVPELEQAFYTRVSETLRHKGRAIQAFDYERLVLQQFPRIFKAKCVNHSFALNASEYINDYPYAPGYVLLAVIPDLRQLDAGNSIEPKVPVSLLEAIEAFVRRRTSPFVRFRAMNPRYERVNFCLKVRLNPGRDENYYGEKIRSDLRELLAPWAVGQHDKLTFGECIFRSDVIRFLENQDYLDHIADLRLGKAGDTPSADVSRICPDTPRSILIAGDIEVCVETPDCPTWGAYFPCGPNGVQQLHCEIVPQPVSNFCP